jgi:hypothetical protein
MNLQERIGNEWTKKLRIQEINDTLNENQEFNSSLFMGSKLFQKIVSLQHQQLKSYR